MTASPLIGVLALQGDIKEHELALTAVGARTARVRTEAELAQVDGLVIPGGESTTMSNLAIRMNLIDPLRAASKAGLPMYGSCAGMIMLAAHVTDARPDQQTIGGLDVTVRRNAFGRQVDSFEIDLDISGWSRLIPGWKCSPPSSAAVAQVPSWRCGKGCGSLRHFIPN